MRSKSKCPRCTSRRVKIIHKGRDEKMDAHAVYYCAHCKKPYHPFGKETDVLVRVK